MAKSLGGLIPIILFLILVYAMILFPETRRKKKFNSMLSELKVNDEIITRGGLVGKIVNMQDENLIIQTGPDRIRLKLNKNAVSGILNQKEEKTDESSK